MKKFISILMAIVIVFSFAACGKNGSVSSKDGDTKVWYFYDKDTDAKKMFENTTDEINPQKIYSSVEYTAEMLYGTYAVNDLEKDIKNLKKELSFTNAEFDNGTFNISTLPVEICNGAKFLPDNEYKFRQVADREVAALRFITGDEIGTVPCTYEVNGNKIKYTSLTDTTQNDEFSYEFDKMVFEYEFSICGPNIELSDGKDSIKLTSFYFTDNNKSSTASMCGYSKEKTPLIDNLDYFSSQQGDYINYAVASDGSYYKKSAYKLTDDGKFTVYLSYKDSDENIKEFTQQYAYIVQSSGVPYFTSFGIILFDGDKEYYYNDDITDREARLLKADGVDVDNMDDEKLKEIAEKKSDLYDDLKNEFETNKISVQINRSTGEIAMDSTVLFGGDSADLTNEGKEFLNKFIKSYTSIICDEKYDGFISKTMVEGHIAPVAGTTYEGGMPLSEQRAKNVKGYCLSDETGVDTAKLASTMETIGYSQSKPVYDSDGNIDIEASRRVSFRFVINIDN